MDDKLKSKIDENNFLVSKNFNFNFNVDYFDYAIALSVFTHLRKSNIIACLKNLKKKINDGIFFSTFFLVNEENKEKPFRQSNQITSYSYKDPFHYTFNEIKEMSENLGFECELVDDFILTHRGDKGFGSSGKK